MLINAAQAGPSLRRPRAGRRHRLEIGRHVIERDFESPRKPDARPGGPPQLPGAAYEVFQAHSTRCTFSTGEQLFLQGEPSRKAFLITRGLVRTYYTSSVGKEITMAYWSPGDIVGGPYFFGGGVAHVWSARAIEESEALEIHCSDLEAIAAKHPSIGHWLTDVLAFKLHWVSSLLQALGTGSVTVRLAHLVLQLTELYGVQQEDCVAIKYRFTQEDLANMVGATRQRVNMILRYFVSEGVLSVGHHQIVVRNKEALRSLVG